jgi:hypothetical protein
MSGYRDLVWQMVAGAVERENTLWEVFIRHSVTYKRALQLNDQQVEVLERTQPRTSMYPDASELAEKGFLHVTLDGQEFALTAKNVCGAAYEDQWRYCLIVFCVSTPSLNESVGEGTTFISVLPEDWHAKLANHLATGDPWEM